MKSLALGLLLGVCVALTTPAQVPCSGPNCHLLPTSSVWDGNGGPWLTGHIYVVQGAVTVPLGETLTIQPGAIVKFDTAGFAPIPLTINGDLQAVGTAASPIIFTSIHDDVGGDTNGSATAPGPGDWKGISFSFGSGGGVGHAMTHCVVRYAGETGLPGVEVLTPNLGFDSCSFDQIAATAVRFNSAAATVTNSSFTNCVRPTEKFPLDGVEGFLGNTASGNTLTDELSVFFGTNGLNIQAPTTWAPANTMNGSGVLIMDVSPKVLSIASLTLEAGMILKGNLANFGMTVSGPLTCNGTAASPVVFAHVDDDTYGGDTMKDGPAVMQPGSWRGLSFSTNASASMLDHVILRYGGGGSAQGLISLATTDLTLTNCTFLGSASAGLFTPSSQPTVTGCSFTDCQTALFGMTLSGLATFSNNSASGNVTGNYIGIAAGSISSAVNLGPTNALATPQGPGAFVLTGSLSVTASGTLTLAPGTVIKSDGNHTLDVDGELNAVGTAVAPIIFSSLADDFGGDTDNAPNVPSPGDWGGLKFTSGASASQLQHVFVRYAGGGATQAAVFLSGIDAPFSLVDCTIQFSSTNGVDLVNTSAPILTNCVMDDGQRPLVRVPFEAIPGITNCTAANNAMGDYLELAGFPLMDQVTLAMANSLNQTGVFVLANDFTVLAAGKLTMDANTVLKVDGSHVITVQGELSVPIGPATITSFKDDINGDTNNAPSAPAPGDWSKLRLDGAPLVSNLTVRYAGAAGVPSIELTATAAGLSSVTVEQGAGAGLGGTLVVSTVVTSCAFDDCQRPVDPVPMDGIQGFSGVTASNNAEGDFLRLNGSGATNLVIGPVQSLNGSGTFVLDASFTTSTNGSVTFSPGTIMKMSGPWVMGIGFDLALAGTPQSPIVLTSIHDDTWGIDTNGAGPAPQPGDWGGIVFNSGSDTSSLTDVVIRYAGAGAPPQPALDLFQTDVTLTRVTIEKCAGDALDAHETSVPTIIDCQFNCNGGKPLEGVTWAMLGSTSGLTAYGNGGGEETVINSPDVIGNVTVHHHSYLGGVIVVNVSPNVNPIGGNGLSFGEGVVIKCGNPNVHFVFNPLCSIRGTAAMPCVITSIADDSIAGDTNGDGNATTPAAGDWRGIEANTMPEIRHLLVRYGGADDAIANPTAALAGSVASVDAVRIEHCAGNAFQLIGIHTNCVAFDNGWNGFSGGVVRYSTAAYNGQRGMTSGPLADGSYRGCISWGNGVADFEGIFYGPPQPGSFYVNELVYCNGYTPLPCGAPQICPTLDFVTDVDPMFVDGPNGDLRLAPGSPMRDVIPLITPVPGGQPGTVYDMETTRTDFSGGSRQIDSDGPGPNMALSDLGAYEACDHDLFHAGTPKIGSSMSWAAQGPAGNALIIYGAGLTHEHAPPYGYNLVSTVVAVQVATVVPVGTPFVASVPDTVQLVGLPFAVQAVVLPAASPIHAVFTNVWKGTIHP